MDILQISLVLNCIATVFSFPDGPPLMACNEMRPFHGQRRDIKRGTYGIIAPKIFNPGERINVRIRGDVEYKGMLLQVRNKRRSLRATDIVGIWLEPSNPNFKQHKCMKLGDGVSHRNNEVKTPKADTFIWQAPISCSHNEVFYLRLTVVQKRLQVETAIEQPIRCDSPPAPPTKVAVVKTTAKAESTTSLPLTEKSSIAIIKDEKIDRGQGHLESNKISKTSTVTEQSTPNGEEGTKSNIGSKSNIRVHPTQSFQSKPTVHEDNQYAEGSVNVDSRTENQDFKSFGSKSTPPQKTTDHPPIIVEEIIPLVNDDKESTLEVQRLTEDPDSLTDKTMSGDISVSNKTPVKPGEEDTNTRNQRKNEVTENKITPENQNTNIQGSTTSAQVSMTFTQGSTTTTEISTTTRPTERSNSPRSEATTERLPSTTENSTTTTETATTPTSTSTTYRRTERSNTPRPMTTTERSTTTNERPTTTTKRSTTPTERSTATSEGSTIPTERSTTTSEGSTTAAKRETSTEGSTTTTVRSTVSTEESTTSTEKSATATEESATTNEGSTIATKRSTTSTERLTTHIERSTTTTETPSTITEWSTTTTDGSTAISENLTTTTERPTTTVLPTAITERPTTPTEESTTTTVRSTTTARPTTTTEMSTTTAKSTASTEESTTSTEESTTSTEESTTSTEESMTSTERSTTTAKSTASTEESTTSTEESMTSTKEQTSTTERSKNTAQSTASSERSTTSTERSTTPTGKSTTNTEMLPTTAQGVTTPIDDNRRTTTGYQGQSMNNQKPILENQEKAFTGGNVIIMNNENKVVSINQQKEVGNQVNNEITEENAGTSVGPNNANLVFGNEYQETISTRKAIQVTADLDEINKPSEPRLYCANKWASIPKGSSTSFENDMGGWRNVFDVPYALQRNLGRTDNGVWGPTSAEDGDSYVYFNSTDLNTGDSAIIRSPYGLKGCFCFSFYYHMDTDGATLSISIKDRTIGRFSNRRDGWIKKSMTITTCDEIIWIMFTVTRGRGIQNEIGLDNLSFKAGRCNESAPYIKMRCGRQ